MVRASAMPESQENIYNQPNLILRFRVQKLPQYKTLFLLSTLPQKEVLIKTIMASPSALGKHKFDFYNSVTETVGFNLKILSRIFSNTSIS